MSISCWTRSFRHFLMLCSVDLDLPSHGRNVVIVMKVCVYTCVCVGGGGGEWGGGGGNRSILISIGVMIQHVRANFTHLCTCTM